MTSTASKDFKGHAISSPTDTLDDGIAKIYTNLHPLLLLAVFYFQFGSLVEDPIESLPRTAIIVGILQVVYVCLCLPGSNHSSLHGKSKTGSKKKTPGPEPGFGFKVVPAILSLILSVTLGAPVLAFALILFGAPFTTHQIHTVLCGVHISLLASLPLFYVHAVDVARWTQIAALNAPIDEVFGATVGTLVGAWAGAIPIPLDWDREWQKWPTTIITGAYIGYAVGKYAGAYLFKGKRIKMS